MKPKWAQFSTDQQVARASRLSKGPPSGCGKKKALQEDVDKRFIVDMFKYTLGDGPSNIKYSLKLLVI
jgi:hypothetical protein